MRRTWTALIVATLLVGAASARGAIGGAQTPDPEPLFNDEDLLFLRHMIVHHQQAVDMANLVPSRSDRKEFVRFTGYVGRGQAAEIAFMQSLLDLAAERGLNVPDHGPHGDPPMAGMLSTAQMDALAAARGAGFERLWLEGMIYHHQGALDMAEAQQRQQLANGRRPYGIAPHVEEILVGQRAEITKMRGWLREWGLASPPDGAGAPPR
jgi:uncharacterized protein (DUF305 family)